MHHEYDVSIKEHIRGTFRVDHGYHEEVSRLVDNSNVSTSWFISLSMCLFLEQLGGKDCVEIVPNRLLKKSRILSGPSRIPATILHHGYD